MTETFLEKLEREAKERARVNNAAILAERMAIYDAIPGPRVGDWVDTPTGSYRIAHHWGDSIQLSSTEGDSYGIYLSVGGASYSGGLDTGIALERFIPTDETRPATVWFFSENQVRAHNGVHLQANFRVFRLA